MESLSPWVALAGGLLIGTAAALLMLLSGRIAGVSGLVANATGIGSGTPRLQAAVFVIGLPLGAVVAAAVARQPEILVTSSIPVLVVAGLLVGFGTRLGSGCTSGHGICGIARFSPRSLAATATFMGTGFAMVFVVRHLIGG
jgi:uncharacterized protein